MKRQEANRAARIIKVELRKLGKKWGCEKHRWDSEPIIRVVESEHSKGWWGVEIRTDGDSYEAFYEMGLAPYSAEKNHQKVMAVLDKKMHFRKGEHYFENYGGGILIYY